MNAYELGKESAIKGKALGLLGGLGAGAGLGWLMRADPKRTAILGGLGGTALGHLIGDDPRLGALLAVLGFGAYGGYRKGRKLGGRLGGVKREGTPGFWNIV